MNKTVKRHEEIMMGFNLFEIFEIGGTKTAKRHV